MLHYVYQLVANLQFGAGEIAYSGFLEPFCWKQLPSVSKNNAHGSWELEKVGMNQNFKIMSDN